MIQYRTDVKNDKIYYPIFRTLNEDYFEFKDLKNKKNKHFFHCENKNRKNLFREIEFYNQLFHSYDLNNILVVYNNDYNSLHLPIIFDLFPQLEFVFLNPLSLISTKHSNLFNKNKIHILSKINNNELLEKVKEVNKHKKKIVYISDLLYENNNTYLKNIIQEQQNIINLNSIAYLINFNLQLKELKYVLPFNNKQTLYDFKDNDKEFIFLKGDIYIPLYNDIKENETYLINIQSNNNKKFIFKKYNLEDLYQKYNLFIQNKNKLLFEFDESQRVKENILGFDDSYESVSEYLIIYNYLINFYFKNKYEEVLMTPFYDKILEDLDFQAKIINIIYEINKNLDRLINENLIICIFDNIIKQKNITLEDFDNIANYYIKIILSIQNQLGDLKKMKILSKEKYIYQISYAKKLIHLINNKMKILLEKIEKENMDKSSFKKIELKIKKILNEDPYLIHKTLLKNNNLDKNKNKKLKSSVKKKKEKSKKVKTIIKPKNYMKEYNYLITKIKKMKKENPKMAYKDFFI